MQERTYRQPVWLQILSSLAALFLIYEVVSPFVGLIYYAVDPTTRLLRQTQNTVAAGQVSLRYEATTFLIFGLEGIVLSALVGLVVIGYKWLNRQINVLRPNLHGLPAVKEPDGWRVLTPPAPTMALPATYEEGTLPPQLTAGSLPSLPVYNQPLNPRYLLYGKRQDGSQIRAPLVDRGTTGIFGLTGTGKTEEIASIIVTVTRLWKEYAVPIELVVFDPKGSDFYGRLPKLACMPYPVVKDPKDVLELAETLVADNLKRQSELTRAGFVSLSHAWQMGHLMPVRVIVIDEVTESLMHMNRAQNARYLLALQSMVQVFRSGGGRVFISTQRPAAKQTPREIVGQLEGGRIVFRCDTDVESRIALGDVGAELLPATKGAMLYRHGAETIQGQSIFADLKYRFGPYMQTLLQPTQTAVTERPLELASPPATLAQRLHDAARSPVTQPLTGAVEAGDITNTKSADDDEAEETNETDPVVGAGVVAASEPFIALVPQDRMPENGREYSIIYATVNECGGQLKPAMRRLYRDRYGGVPEGGPYFYWTRYGYAMALKARDRVVDLRGDPVKEDWLVVPKRYQRLGRR